MEDRTKKRLQILNPHTRCTHKDTIIISQERVGEVSGFSMRKSTSSELKVGYISVLVATRNRREDLCRCLSSILANDYENFEVIVVDQSTDRASEEAILRLESPRVRYVRHDGVGKSRAVNLGLKYVSGEFLALTDDDCTVPVTWLRHSAALLEREPDSGLVCGSMVPVEHDWAKVLIPTKRIERYRKVSGLSGRLRHPSGTAGGNLFVRTNVFKKLEGYDEELGPGATFHGVEDGDLEYRALVAGVNVLEDPDSEVLHWGARDYESGAARELQYRYAFSIGAFMMKHIRCLDPVAPLIFTRFAFGQLRRVLPSLILGRRPSGAGFLVHFFQGFWKARPWPLDRRMRRFRSS